MQENEIVERILMLCKTRSWTTYRLAKESGITYSTLCTILHKSTVPSISTLIKICNGFGITLSQFFDEDNDRAILSEKEKEHLRLWEKLSEENRKIAEKYIDYLLFQQNQEIQDPDIT